VVGIIACSVITSLGVLGAVTERSGLRLALSSAPRADTEVSISLFQPSGSVAKSRTASDAATRALLGPAAAGSTVSATSSLVPVPQLDGSIPALAYFAENRALRSHSLLVAGDWPAGSQVALPEAAARSFGLTVGDSVTVDAGTVVTIAGLYRAERSPAWRSDRLNGSGNETSYPKPDTRAFIPTHAFGPLLLADGGFDALGVRAQAIELDYAPDFRDFEVSGLAPLADRLEGADTQVPYLLGDDAARIVYGTDLDGVVGDAIQSLLVTRATVTVVALLLLTVAMAALIQAAQLFSAAGSRSRDLMRRRGASARQVVGLAAVEAATLAFVIGAAGALLSQAVYLLLARLPPMVAAGMPAQASLRPADWATAGLVALASAVVIVAPTLGSVREAESERRSRLGGLARSGLDLGVVALAAVALWQLQVYRSPIVQGTSLRLDPVLTVGPAIILIGGALLAARLVAPAARLASALAAKSRGVVLPLAGWEVGRRTQRATAAVLLLTLTVALGTFSESFLASWKQSQIDQAGMSVGPAVRVPGKTTPPGDDPQPVIRRSGLVAGPDADLSTDNPDGTPATILGLTADARRQLNTGRNAREGGKTIVTAIRPSFDAGAGIDLPRDVRGLSATVQLGSTPVPGALGTVRAMVQTARNTITTVDLGSVPLDGLAHRVSGRSRVGDGAQFVGFQVELRVGDQELYPRDAGTVTADLLFGDVAALAPESGPRSPLHEVPISAAPLAGWSARQSVDPRTEPALDAVPSGWQFRIGTSIPADLDVQTQSVVIMAWGRERDLPAVLSGRLSRFMGVSVGAPVSVVLPGAIMSATVSAVVSDVPGSLGGSGTIVVDQMSLQRALAARGISTPMVDEWWVDVPDARALGYIDALRRPAGAAPVASSTIEAQQLQQSPLRVATQAALLLAIVSAAVLAALGFGVHTAATLAARRSELAQLRAVGLRRRHVVLVIGAETLLLGGLGTALGLALGIVLSLTIAPVAATSPTGALTVPGLQVVFPWGQILLLIGLIAVVIAAVVLLVARDQRAIDPARILRAGSA